MTRRLWSRDARLWVRTSGAGAPLVLVHGWAMDHRIFRYQERAFARDFRVVTFDRRGFGRSGGEPDLARELDDLDLLADTLIGAADAFHLLGLSQGGRIALRYAAARPERVRSLVLQGAPVDGEQPPGPADEQVPMAAFAALARAGRLDELRQRWLRHPMMRLGDGHAEAEALLREMLEDYTGADLIRGGWPPPATDVLGAVAAAGLPVLILTGARETRSRRRSARLLRERLPRSRERVLPHGGHLCNLTEPDAYNAAVIEFCRAVTPPPP
ncbi:MAG: alpha/beta fold hydrolase [Pseudomonadota bacterium]